jgi:hypothetical protein
MTQSTRAVISSADSPFGQLWRRASIDLLVQGHEDQPVFPDRPSGLLGPDLVRFQSLVIPVVPLANVFSEDMVRCLREVARQVMESIMCTTTG